MSLKNEKVAQFFLKNYYLFKMRFRIFPELKLKFKTGFEVLMRLYLEVCFISWHYNKNLHSIILSIPPLRKKNHEWEVQEKGPYHYFF